MKEGYQVQYSYPPLYDTFIGCKVDSSSHANKNRIINLKYIYYFDEIVF